MDSASETDLRSGTLSPAPAGEEAADNVAVPRAARGSNGDVPTASDAGAFLQEPEVRPLPPSAEPRARANAWARGCGSP